MGHSIETVTLRGASPRVERDGKSHRGRRVALLPVALMAVVALAGCSFMQQFGFVSPDTPTGLAVSNATDTTLDVSWDPSNGAKSYTVSQASSQNGSYAAVATVSGTSTTVTGLTANTSYWFKVSATNTAGSSPASAAVQGTTTGPGGGGGGGSTTVPLSSFDTWQAESLTSSVQTDDVTFTATAGHTYAINWDDGYYGSGSYTLDVVVTALHADGVTAYFSPTDTAFAGPKLITPSSSETVTLRVQPFASGETGTFAVMVIDVTGVANIGSVIPLSDFYTVDGGSLAGTGDVVDYVFTATAGHTYYAYWNDSVDGTATYTADIQVAAYHMDGSPVFAATDSGWTTGQAIAPLVNEIITLEVTYKTATGTFGIEVDN